MKPYKIIIASDTDYEELIAEINIDGKFAAAVTQEKGKGIFNIEFPGIGLVESQIIRKVDFDSFIEALNEAKQKLFK